MSRGTTWPDLRRQLSQAGNQLPAEPYVPLYKRLKPEGEIEDVFVAEPDIGELGVSQRVFLLPRSRTDRIVARRSRSTARQPIDEDSAVSTVGFDPYPPEV